MLKIREWLRRRNKSKELQILAQNLNYPSLLWPGAARISKKLNQYLANILERRDFSDRIFEISFVFSLKLTTYRLKLIRCDSGSNYNDDVILSSRFWKQVERITGDFLGKVLHPLQTEIER